MSEPFTPKEIDRYVRGAWAFSNGWYGHCNSFTVAEVIFLGNGNLYFAITPEIKWQHASFLLERQKLYLSPDEMTSVVAFFEWALAQNEHPSLTQEARKWLNWHKECEQRRHELYTLLAQLELEAKSAELC